MSSMTYQERDRRRPGDELSPLLVSTCRCNLLTAAQPVLASVSRVGLVIDTEQVDMAQGEYRNSRLSEAFNENLVGGRSRHPDHRPVKIAQGTGNRRRPKDEPPTHPPPPAVADLESGAFNVRNDFRPPDDPPASHQPVDRFRLDAANLEHLDFPQRLAVLGGPNLFGKTHFYNIELASLQKMVIHDLQQRLVRLVADIHNKQWAGEGTMQTAKKLLDDYSSAIRNYDLMNEKKEQNRVVGHTNPFLITTEDRLSFILMEQEGLFRHAGLSNREVENLTERYRRRSTLWDPESNMLPGQSRTEQSERKERGRLRRQGFFERLTLGVFGGLAIIVPMLIMALINSLLVSLVVTSVATMIFAVLLALPMLGGAIDGKTALASVAAYAAVLVVFVGTSVSGT